MMRGAVRGILVVASACYLLLLVVATHHPRPGDLVGRGIADKPLHFIAYTILGGLMTVTLASAGRASAVVLATVCGVLTVFAAADELTQPIFGRTADALDWAFDLLGIAVGVVGAAALCRLLGHRRDTRA